jgi:hypothetical protein
MNFLRASKTLAVFLVLALLIAAMVASAHPQEAPALHLRRRSLPMPTPFELATSEDKDVAKYQLLRGRILAECICRAAMQVGDSFCLRKDTCKSCA